MPATLNLQARLCNLDHTLALYPIPDLLIHAESSNGQRPWMTKREDCLCVCPSSMPASNFSFLTYYPASKKAEICRITESE